MLCRSLCELHRSTGILVRVDVSLGTHMSVLIRALEWCVETYLSRAVAYHDGRRNGHCMRTIKQHVANVVQGLRCWYRLIQ